ncbi:uncharacterized protein J3D65DRAFT_599409 [Phyllosticta citribraziliensis]|uniref:Uncharacterized protein n=1 Tax=Phyllosticta citribraziliensis TaxID=989973 RepID=A0ABR1MBI0_9PEZI
MAEKMIGLCLAENDRQEARRLAFPHLRVQGQPTVSDGLPFDQLLVHHVLLGRGRERIFILTEIPMAPGPLEIPPVVTKVHEALGPFLHSTWYAMGTGGWHEVIHIVRQMREFAADALIAVGSDLIIDLAKVVLYAHSSLIADEEKLLEILLQPTPTEIENSRGRLLDREEEPHRPQLDFFCIPTTCGGAAFTQRAFGFNEAMRRCCTLVRTLNYPKIVILDGEATMSTPLGDWNTKGAEAINHAVEGILSINASPHVVRQLTDALKLLCAGLLATKRSPQHVEARHATLRGANIAMAPLASRPQVSWGASHAFCNAGHRLFVTEPGLMAAVVLPSVLEFNVVKIRCQPSLGAIQKMADQYRGMAAALWEPRTSREFFQHRGFKQNTTNIANMLRALFNYLGLPSNLAALGITKKSQRQLLAEGAVCDPCSQSAPVRLMHSDHAMQALERVRGAEEPEDEELPIQQSIETDGPVGCP